jgi:hypothetical protein
MIYITVPDKNDSISRIKLSGNEYYIRFTYNPKYDYWSFGLYKTNMEPILPMTKIVPFSPLTYFYTYTDLPDGDFGCLSADAKVGRDSFTEKRARFVYIPNSDLKGAN